MRELEITIKLKVEIQNDCISDESVEHLTVVLDRNGCFMIQAPDDVAIPSKIALLEVVEIIEWVDPPVAN